MKTMLEVTCDLVLPYFDLKSFLRSGSTAVNLLVTYLLQ